MLSGGLWLQYGARAVVRDTRGGFGAVACGGVGGGGGVRGREVVKGLC